MSLNHQGLGKTLSMIALILASEELPGDQKDTKDYDGGTLLVCPVSVMGQWEKEIEDHVKRNHLNVLKHHGPKRETKARDIAKYDVVISTYNTVSYEQNSEVSI
jgi:SNF2 family DNA or RNA helicase